MAKNMVEGKSRLRSGVTTKYKLDAGIIEAFTTSLLASRYDDPKPIPQFHREMWELCTSDFQKIAIAAPRGHAKSTAITFAYLLACVLFRLNDHVLLLSSNEQLASAFLHDIYIELQENDELIKKFKFAKFLKESEGELIGQFEDGSKFRILAKGQGKVRGTKWEGKRPNLVVIDDIEDDEVVLNKHSREKFRRWVYAVIRPILSNNGVIRIVGTILHMDSFLERLMPAAKDRDTINEPLKISSVTVKNGWKSVKYRAHDSEFNHILWPEQFSKARLQDIREEYVQMGLQDLYSQEYLNDPIDETLAFFVEESFNKSPSSEEWINRQGNFYATGDLAISKDKQADYTAFVVAKLDILGRLEIVHARRGRWDAPEIIANIFEIQKYYHPEIFGIEKGSIERALGPYLYSEMRKQNIYPTLDLFSSRIDKKSRARSIQGRLKSGSVFFQKDNGWYEDLHDELKRFDRAEHDDYVDCMSSIGQLLDKMLPVSTKEEMEEEMYFEEFRRGGGDPYSGGKNRSTGY